MSQISEILESVQSGNSLTANQYEILADGSEAETVQAVGADGAEVIEAAYHNYVVELLAK